ncbi:hypothetical protein AAC387_Pa03g3025 [Persea americana]|eukprot:TRINITY_DN44307_c0_g1_i1.p1 TRINITY_DN44307_c0_g1~~TRINITY_DN44307_c0_g1_i1.p1  ORF type:complete len:307 (-),score=86.65 TRINITY_DN44307_c0_g1_i1:343-1149(-)
MESGRLVFDGSGRGNMFFFGSGDQTFLGGTRPMLTAEESFRKHPFFSSPEELEEECYDEQMPEKKRRLTQEQVHLLERSFESENKLEPEKKSQLAKKLGLQPRQVAVWFQNRRARWKTKQLERNYDLLKASYESLLTDYNSVAKENERLRAEVVSITVKLQAKEVIGQQTDPLLENAVGQIPTSMTAKDRLSSSSGGSAVVDEDSPQLIDSGDSYFPDYPSCVGGVDGVPSEEEDGSDDSRSYFSDAFVAAEQPQEEDGEPLAWWAWS